MKKLKFAIDFDDTITAEPRLFHDFAAWALKLGHEVRIVTYRHGGADNTDIMLFNASLNLPVFFTDGQPKFEYCKKHGWVPDIIIDDHPATWGEDINDVKF